MNEREAADLAAEFMKKFIVAPSDVLFADIRPTKNLYTLQEGRLMPLLSDSEAAAETLWKRWMDENAKRLRTILDVGSMLRIGVKFEGREMALDKNGNPVCWVIAVFVSQLQSPVAVWGARDLDVLPSLIEGYYDGIGMWKRLRFHSQIKETRGKIKALLENAKR